MDAINTSANIKNNKSSESSENKVIMNGFNEKLDSLDESKNTTEIQTETEQQQQQADTAKCLEEFDEILQEINRDVAKEPASLDEIDNVLNNIEEVIVKAESLSFEIPIFDLEDLLQGYDSLIENNLEDVNENNLNKIHEPIDDKTNEIKKYLDKPTEIADFFTTLWEDDVISISSADSQADEVTVEGQGQDLNVNDENVESKDVTEGEGRSGEPKNVSETQDTNGKPRNVIENYIINAGEPKNVTETEDKNRKTRNVTETEGITADDLKNVTDTEGTNGEARNVTENNNDLNAGVPKNLTETEDTNGKARNVTEKVGTNADEPKNVTEHGGTNDEPQKVKDANNEINKTKNVKDNEEITSKSEDGFLDESDDCGYHSSDFEFITEDEAKLDGLVVNFDPNMLKGKVSKSKRVKTIELTVDQVSEQRNVPSRKRPMQKNASESNNLGYGPSNQRNGELNNVTPSLNTKRRSRHNKMQVNAPELDNLGPGPSNMHGKVPQAKNTGSRLRNIRRVSPELNNLDSGASNLQMNPGTSSTRLHVQNNITGPMNGQRDIPDYMQVQIEINDPEPNIKINYPGNIERDGRGLYHFRPGPSNLQGNSPGLSNLQPNAPGPSILQQNAPGPSNLQLNAPGPSNLQQNAPGPSNLQRNAPGPSNLQQNAPGPSNLQRNAPGPSNLQRNAPGPSNLQRHCPQIFDHNLERWRRFHPRNQLRHQFAVDLSYRENHRVLEGDEFYQLFTDNSEILRNQRFLENKSIVPRTSSMFAEYDGLGFDMQMLRETSESDEDEVKEEAGECARKIFEMYPGQNTRKKRRRF